MSTTAHYRAATRRALGGVLLCTATAAAAQGMAPVTVRATGGANDAQTTTYEHEELARGGDSTLADVLRRLPGLTLDPDGRVLLRGMGGGYVQVLLDGRPLGVQGQGPMLDGLGSEFVERIEIVRGASAADGGEGIAGTLRITTREADGAPLRRATAEAGATRGGHSQRLGLQWGDRQGDVAWRLAARWRDGDSATQRHAVSRITGPDGTLYQAEDTRQRTGLRSREWVLQGALDWKPGGDDEITLKLLAERGPTRRTTAGTSLADGRWRNGPTTTITHDDEPRFQHIEPQLRWQHRLATGGTLRLDYLQSRVASHDVFQTAAFDGAGEPQDASDWQGASVERSRRLAVRVEQPVSAHWRWTAGAELRRDRGGENAVSDGEPETSRLARRALGVFGQVQWQPAPGWRVETGLRRERQHTATGDADDPAQRRNSAAVWLPSLDLGWAQGADRLWHLGVARTYRQPRLNDLSPGGRSTGGANSAFFPDVRGNPSLRNERAHGIEAGVTQAHGSANLQGERPGELRIGLFARDIQDAIVRQLSLRDDGRWVQSPANIGQTRVRGAEAQWRWDFARLARDDAWHAPLVVRADLTITRSTVAATAAPARLAGQAPIVAGLGFDAGSRTWPAVTWGATLKLESGYAARASATSLLRTRTLATMDAYALWKIDAQTRLRLRATQWGQDWRTRLVSATSDTGSQQTETARLSRAWTAALGLERDF